MKKALTFILGTLIFFISSCKKDVFRTRIEGELVGLTEGQPIADADVTIYGAQSGGFLNGTAYTNGITTKTDKDGKFSFNIKKESGFEYKIFARKKDYFDEETTLGVQSYVYLPTLSKPFKTKVKLYLHEPAFINLTAINTSNYSDSIRVSFNNLKNSNESIGFNCSIDQLVFPDIIIPANRDYEDNYQVLDSQVNFINSGYISITKCKAYSTNNVLFDY